MLMFGGIFADRLDRRWMLFYSRAIVALLIVAAATLTVFGLISMWYIYAISFTLGTIQGLNMPTQMAIVPDLVDEDDILNATALNMAVFNTGAYNVSVLSGMDHPVHRDRTGTVSQRGLLRCQLRVSTDNKWCGVPCAIR